MSKVESTKLKTLSAADKELLEAEMLQKRAALNAEINHPRNLIDTKAKANQWQKQPWERARLKQMIKVHNAKLRSHGLDVRKVFNVPGEVLPD